MLVNLNGKYLKEDNAAISVNNRSFRYGDGCFETMKYCRGKLLFANYHFERLFTSLTTLQFDCPGFFTTGYLQQQIEELVIKNQHTKLARIRLTLFSGNGGLYDAENRKPNWLIQSWPLNPATNILNTNGLVTGVYKQGFKAADLFANIKSNNYLLYSQAALVAQQQHWNDALVLNHRQTIADATIANIFLVKGNTITTPPLTDGPVNGVMRRYLLEALSSLNYQVIEQTIAAEDIGVADEAFLSNAIYGIKWIQSIDEHQLKLNHAAIIYKQLLEPLFAG